MAPQYKGRVLFLHGLAQSSSVFYAKSSALRKKLLALQYLPVYLNAPTTLTPAQLPTSDALSKFGAVSAEPDEKTNFRAWWTKNADGTFDVDGAIDTIRQYIEHGTIAAGSPEDARANTLAQGEAEAVPVVGLVGFSQGAALGGLVVHRFAELFGCELEFAVLYSGFRVDATHVPAIDAYYTRDGGAGSRTRLLHVVGELDTVVGEDRAYTFYETSRANSDLLMHPGGHFVPNSRVMVDRVTGWIQAGAAPAPAQADSEADRPEDLLAMMDKFGG